MNVKSLISLFIIGIFSLFLLSCGKEKDDKEEASSGVVKEEIKETAILAARNWLNLIDTGKYDESWEKAAPFFKNAVDKNEWVKSLESLRGPLGKVIERRVEMSQYRTELPGAPDGEYVLIQFNTSFKNKENAIETVTPMKCEDGTWKVSGYYVK